MEDFLLYTQEESSVFLLSVLSETFFASYFDCEVCPEVEDELVVSKEGVLWKLKEWGDTLLVVEDD